MDRDFIKRSVLVWLEVEREKLAVMHKGKFGVPRLQREKLAESLTNHLANNWDLIQRVKHDIHRHPENEGPCPCSACLPIIRDTPEYYERGE